MSLLRLEFGQMAAMKNTDVELAGSHKLLEEVQVDEVIAPETSQSTQTGLAEVP